jgi:hypothetical protein
MLGSDLLVWPIVWPDAREEHFSLPPGVWFDWHTGLIHGGGQPVRVPAELDHLALFVRAGAILPMQSAVESTTEVPAEPLMLDVWPFGDSKGSLYEDDGLSLAYQRGEFCRSEFWCRVGGDEVTVFLPACMELASRKPPLLRLHGLGRPVASVKLMGEPPAEVEDASARAAKVVAVRPSQDRRLSSPGDFRYDADNRCWLVRAFARDRRQTVVVALGDDDGVARDAVTLRFDAKRNPIRYHRSVLPPTYADGAVSFVVRQANNPQMLLPRLRLSADALPLLKVRVAAEHATKLGVRFATEQDPTLSNQPALPFDLTPDGKSHDYMLDLVKVSEGRWSGTVYWVMLSFPEGSEQGETLTIESVSFEPREELRTED